MTTENTITPEQYSERIDRSSWRRGPWDGEPDFVRFESHGLPCIVLRHPRSGHLCGYVAVPPGHPWHGVDFATLWREDGCPNVHGGVTYAERCAGSVCHVAKPGDPDDVWWLGFDANHAWDVSPRDASWGDGDYRDIGYMRRECERLAEQCAARAESPDVH